MLAGAILALTLATAAWAETAIKFSYELPVAHNFHKGAEMLAQKVLERTHGEVKLELFPAGQLAKDSTFIKAITSGSIDGGLSPTLYWTGIMPIAGVFDVPYVMTTHEEAQKVLAGPAGDRLLKGLEKFDLVGLGYFDFGFGIYGNNKRPLPTPADFKGLRIRANNDIGAQLLQTFGASPTFLSGGEVFMALEHGTVDGTHTALTSITERKMYTVMKYLTVDNHNYIPYFVVFRKSVLDKLTPEQQTILRTAVSEVSQWVEQQQAKDDAEAVAILRDKGMQVIELNPAQLKTWRDAAQPVREAWIKKVGKEGEDLLQDVERDKAK